MKNKKLFAILTLVCFMFTLMPVAAMAEETTGETWDWDATEKILTLTNAQITTGSQITVPDGTTIKLIGENKIEVDADKGIYAEGAVTIQGEGSLEIITSGHAIYAEKAGGDASITIDGVTLTANGSIATADTCVNASLILKNAADVNIERNNISIRNDNGTRGENGPAGTATISMDNSKLYCGPVFVGAWLSNNHSYTRTSAVYSMNGSSVDIQGSGKSAMIYVWGDCGVDFDVVDSNVKIWNSGWQQNDIDIQGGNDHYNVAEDGVVVLDVNIEQSNLDMYGYWSGLSVGRYYDDSATINFNMDESTVSTMTKYGSSGITIADNTGNGTTTKTIKDSIIFLTNDPGHTGTEMNVNATIYGSPVVHQDYTIVHQTGGTNDFSTVDYDFVLDEGQTLTIQSGKTMTSAKAITLMPGAKIIGNYVGEVIIPEGYTAVITGEGDNKKIEVFEATKIKDIATAEELRQFATDVNNGNSHADMLVRLTGDIDLNNEEWTPIGQTGTSYGAKTYFQGVFDGQGHTISNLSITATNAGEHYAAGLFGFIDAADATIRNLKVDKANVNGHHWVGVIAGYLTGEISNCEVSNATVVCSYANNAASGDKAGVIVGQLNSGSLKNNTVTNCSITACRDVGGITGAADCSKYDVINNKVNNLTIKIVRPDGYEEKATNAGDTVGRILAGSVDASNTALGVVLPYVTEITLADTTIEVGKKVQLIPVETPANNAAELEYVWASSDENIAIVDATGKVTAVAEGATTITAITSAFKDINDTVTKELKATCEVSVTATSTQVPSTSSSGGGFTGKYNYPVNIADTIGATVTSSENYAVAGETVTITVDPDAGKQVDEVIVTDADGDVITVNKVGDNKYTFTMPAGKVNVAVTTEAADYDLRIVMQINNKNILVNNRTFTNDVAPVIVGDRTMVPIRVVTETLGGTADWNANTQTVTLKIDGKVLTMTIGKVIPGIGVAPVIMNDRTYVPIRYVAEKLGANVEWIAQTQQIIIEQ